MKAYFPSCRSVAFLSYKYQMRKVTTNKYTNSQLQQRKTERKGNHAVSSMITLKKINGIVLLIM